MTHVDIVFDGPPGPVAGRFVEVENAAGQSISFGEWVQRPDGHWVLRIAQAEERNEAMNDMKAVEAAARALCRKRIEFNLALENKPRDEDFLQRAEDHGWRSWELDARTALEAAALAHQSGEGRDEGEAGPSEEFLRGYGEGQKDAEADIAHREAPEWMSALLLLLHYEREAKLQIVKPADFEARRKRAWDDAWTLYASKPGDLSLPPPQAPQAGEGPKLAAFIADWDRISLGSGAGEWTDEHELPDAERQLVIAALKAYVAQAPQAEGCPTIEQLKKALSLAVNMLSVHEPPDSRAVSDEFVALACVDCGVVKDSDMTIIERALAAPPLVAEPQEQLRPHFDADAGADEQVVVAEMIAEHQTGEKP